jgi:hypothetical protein
VKVLFLDIDGPVVNTRSILANPQCDCWYAIDTIGVALLVKIAKKYDVKIVSNTARHSLDFDVMKSKLEMLGLVFYGSTNLPKTLPRKQAIVEWLEANPEVEQWAAVDDEFIDHENAVLIDYDEGITTKAFLSILNILDCEQDDGIIILKANRGKANDENKLRSS